MGKLLGIGHLILCVMLCLLTGWADAESLQGPSTSSGLAGIRPNIVLVMTDDQGMGDLSCMGNEILKTPHIDRFYAQSTRFADFHVSPTCAPTRSAMMSGRPPFEVGVTHTIFQRERLAPAAITFPEALQQAGYTTGLFGKWHLGDEEAYLPQNRGFDEVLMHGAGGIGQYGFGDFKANTENTYFDNVLLHNDTIVKTKGFCTDVFFHAGLAWIKEQVSGVSVQVSGKEEGEEESGVSVSAKGGPASGGQVSGKEEGGQESTASNPHPVSRTPFFAYISLNAPHGPMIAPDKYKKRFLDQGYDEKTAARYGMIENIDDNMGLLMEKLTAWNTLENTLVIFMTDNGMSMGAGKKNGEPFHRHNAGLRGGKNSPWEGGTHVPAFWRWQGVLGEGVDVPALTAHLDLYRTFCDLAGADVPESKLPPKGRSLVPLLENPKAKWLDRRLFIHQGRWGGGRNKASLEDSQYANCAVRSQRWRLVFSGRKGKLQTHLSDISADPGEATNVADQYPEVVKDLTAAYDQWWDSLGPLLVNEGLPKVAPEDHPLTVRYEKQLAEEGIPDWSPEEL